MPKIQKTEKKEKSDAKSATVRPAVKRVRAVAAKPPKIKSADQTLEVSDRKKTEKYYEAIGRRKTSVARVRLYTRGDKIFLINDKQFNQYFKNVESKNIVEAPLVKMNCVDRFRVTARVFGGGLNSQAEALRHGIARALVMFNPDFKKRLKKSGYLTRDPRMKERKKPGLKRARRAPQWAKR